MKIGRRTLLGGVGAAALVKFVGSRMGASPGGHGVASVPSPSASLASETVAAMKAENATIVKLGTGGFPTLEAALASIVDASPNNVYRIQAAANPDGYEMTNVAWKDNVELEGMGDAPVLFRCELPASADPIAVSYARPLHGVGRARFANIHVRAKNCRYPLDIGVDDQAGFAPVAVGCVFEHLGNDEVSAYQVANNNHAGFIGSEQCVGTTHRRRGYATA